MKELLCSRYADHLSGCLFFFLPLLSYLQLHTYIYGIDYSEGRRALTPPPLVTRLTLSQTHQTLSVTAHTHSPQSTGGQTQRKDAWICSCPTCWSITFTAHLLLSDKSTNQSIDRCGVFSQPTSSPPSAICLCAHRIRGAAKITVDWLHYGGWREGCCRGRYSPLCQGRRRGEFPVQRWALCADLEGEYLIRQFFSENDQI